MLLTAQQAYEDKNLQITQEGIDELVEEGKIEPVTIDGIDHYDREQLKYYKKLYADLMKNTRATPEYGY